MDMINISCTNQELIVASVGQFAVFVLLLLPFEAIDLIRCLKICFLIEICGFSFPFWLNGELLFLTKDVSNYIL